jgi:hypothetical protein
VLSSELRKSLTLACERPMPGAPGTWLTGVFESLFNGEGDGLFEVPSPELDGGDKCCLARALGRGKGNDGECQLAINDVDILAFY